MEKSNKRFKLPTYVKWILWVLLVQLVLVNISAALYAWRLSHVSEDPSLYQATPSRNIFTKTWRLFSGPRQAKSKIMDVPVFPVDTVKLKTDNGIFIDAWYSKPDSQAKGTVILFHGISSNKGNLLHEAGDFRYQGYNVLLVDFRAHGNSGGAVTTIGAKETEEVKLAYEFVRAKGERNIFLWGMSMGAVVITEAVSQYTLQPAGVILEMPFESLQKHLQGRARLLGFPGFPEKPFGFFVTLWMGIERGFNGFKHNTARAAGHLYCPVLMQWGAQDHLVRRDETDKIYAAIASAQKKLVIYDHASHESLLQNDPVTWRANTEMFLRTFTR